MTSIAILIDCWDIPHKDAGNKLSNNILNFIDTNSDISAVILASYNARDEKVRADTTWYQNSSYFFNNDFCPQRIRDLEYVHKQFEMYERKYKNENTHPAILNYVNTDKFQIAMHWPWELEFYLSNNPNVEYAYVLGTAWDECVRNRPLGYKSLSELNSVSILTNTECVLDMSCKHPDLTIDNNWQQLQENIWRYRP